MEINNYTEYLIYEDGRVWSKKSNKFLKPTTGGIGYKQVMLCNEGKHKRHSIHRLVALHYIPNPENKKCVDHINRIKTDNRIQNLRWATHSENQQNRSFNKDNTSGHKYISYNKNRNTWEFYKMINKKTTKKIFKSKTDALCYKFIILLKIKSSLI